MNSNKRGVASVKQISKKYTVNSQENSLSRLRQNSWKHQGLPFEDIATHLKKCKETCNSVSKRLNSKEKEPLTINSALSSKLTKGIAKSSSKHKKTDAHRKRPKNKEAYSNMKMLYQNAVYKSLNLNLSPSTSSVRSENTSRDISIKSRGDDNSSKNMLDADKLADQRSANFKFQIQGNLSSTDRTTNSALAANKAKYENAELECRKNPAAVSQERKTVLTQQFYSPSDSRRIAKYKSKTELSVEKKFSIGNKPAMVRLFFGYNLFASGLIVRADCS